MGLKTTGKTRGKMDVAQVSINDAEYPELLRKYPFSPPRVLYRIGEAIPSNKPLVAVAGTREPSDYGRELARRLGRELARNGFVVVTGFASGVDAEATYGAMEASGHVIGVLPWLFEDGNKKRLMSNTVLRKLSMDGYSKYTIISENLVRDPANAEQLFALRNRVIDGMSVAVIIVETRYKPQGWGTSFHIRFGLEVGKPVFIFMPTWAKDWAVWEGYREFIRRGATPVKSIEEVIALIRQAIGPPTQPTP